MGTARSVGKAAVQSLLRISSHLGKSPISVAIGFRKSTYMNIVSIHYMNKAYYIVIVSRYF